MRKHIDRTSERVTDSPSSAFITGSTFAGRGDGQVQRDISHAKSPKGVENFWSFRLDGRR